MEKITEADLEKVLQQAKNELIKLFTNASTNTSQIGIARERVDIMNEQWTTARAKIVETYGGMAISWEHKINKMSKWFEHATTKAAEKVAYETTSYDRLSSHKRKDADHYVFANAWARSKNEFFVWYKNEYTGVTHIWEANPLVPRLTAAIRDEFQTWFQRQVVTQSLLDQSSAAAMHDFLSERPDMIVLLNLIPRLPKIKSISQGTIDRPAAVAAIELTLSLVPFLGNAIALYELWAGRDLFGYELSHVEQAILAASILLPVAGRMVKGGRALYTEARLVKLYGKNAASWGKVLNASARASEQPAAIRSIEAGEEALAKLGRVEGKIAQEAAAGVKAVVHSPGTLPRFVAPETKVLWETLSKKYPILDKLDEIALDRVLRKGPNMNHIKGQLLEELAESHLIPMLRERHVGFALGVKVPQGKTLEFIPGYSIMDASGRQITDGVLGYTDKQVFNILAIFEAKAGRKGARELTVTTTRVSKMSQDDLLEVKAEAKESWLNARGIARRKKQPFSKTVADFEKKLLKTKDSGQLQRDLERLSRNAGKPLPKIYIGEVDTAVRISPNNTKFFGIFPKGIRTSLVEAEAKAAGFKFEALTVPIHKTQLNAMAQELAPHSKRMVTKEQ
ncbi:hypothetical protein RJZ56_005277 [Blastomyces dermatitidis]|uniref:Pre-toxin TG domain-containing protein n=1 Tax=Blastomyces gilchristii (strain SLH14081) TaxID=559298 RepID=A0A179UCB1_BLAGS|nr:uncharacterized protein BDBG_01791 [Blastomyces gilchristii SLH14081]OAT05383.1 hypothetical protein BDBG_01791 [Blastomyces gilchristii SLH14081]